MARRWRRGMMFGLGVAAGCGDVWRLALGLERQWLGQQLHDGERQPGDQHQRQQLRRQQVPPTASGSTMRRTATACPIAPRPSASATTRRGRAPHQREQFRGQLQGQRQGGQSASRRPLAAAPRARRSAAAEARGSEGRSSSAFDGVDRGGQAVNRDYDRGQLVMGRPQLRSRRWRRVRPRRRRRLSWWWRPAMSGAMLRRGLLAVVMLLGLSAGAVAQPASKRPEQAARLPTADAAADALAEAVRKNDRQGDCGDVGRRLARLRAGHRRRRAAPPRRPSSRRGTRATSS